MRIAFATTQSVTGSTNVGRILPLAEEFAKRGAECFVLVQARPLPPNSTAAHTPTGPANGGAGRVTLRLVGTQPWRRTPSGKERLRGIQLVLNVLATAGRTAWVLHTIRPDVIIISKALPANVLGVSIFALSYKLLARSFQLVLDADDFELTANQLSSLYQRGAIHWSQRRGAALADVIVVASPFLSSHFKQLTQNTKPVKIIPTGIADGIAGGATTRDRPSPAEAGYGLRRQDPPATYAYLGSVSVSSGHRVDLLPDILEQSRVQYPDMKLLIAGDGDDVASIKEEFSRRNLTKHVTWFGRFSPADLGQLVTAQTIIIDPVDDSIANRSKSSFRVLLAAALGLPVVTSNIGIRPRLVPEQFHERFFADPADPESYAQKSIALAQHPLTADERHQLQQHASAYTWPKLGVRYYDILKV